MAMRLLLFSSMCPGTRNHATPGPTKTADGTWRADLPVWLTALAGALGGRNNVEDVRVGVGSYKPAAKREADAARVRPRRRRALIVEAIPKRSIGLRSARPAHGPRSASNRSCCVRSFCAPLIREIYVTSRPKISGIYPIHI